MPRLAKPLNIKEIEALTKPGLTAIGNNLYIQIDSSGKYFVYRYKVRGSKKRTMVRVGKVGVMTLKQARIEAAKLFESVEKGHDIALDRQKELLAQRHITQLARARAEKKNYTVAFCAEKFIEQRSKSGYWNKNTRGEEVAISYIKRNILPLLGKKNIANLTPDDVYKVLAPIWQSQPGASDATKSLIFHIWRWASAKGWCKGENPADTRGALGVLLEPLNKNRKKSEPLPALDFKEIPDFIALCLLKKNISYQLVAFSIITVLRSKMVRFAKWSDYNEKEKTLTIPEESIKTKGRGEHTVYLSSAAIEILNSLPRCSEYIFPNTRLLQPLSDNAPSAVFHEAHSIRYAKDNIGWVDPVMTKQKGFPVVATQHGTARAGFKTWARTGQNRKLLDDEAVELCMAHKLKDDYNGAYNRATLKEERIFVMEEWGDFCLEKYRELKEKMPWA